MQEEGKSYGLINHARSSHLYRGKYQRFVNHRGFFALPQSFHRCDQDSLLSQEEEGLVPGLAAGEGAGPPQGQEHHHDAGARLEPVSGRDQGAPCFDHSPERRHCRRHRPEDSDPVGASPGVLWRRRRRRVQL